MEQRKHNSIKLLLKYNLPIVANSMQMHSVHRVLCFVSHGMARSKAFSRVYTTCEYNVLAGYEFQVIAHFSFSDTNLLNTVKIQPVIVNASMRN